MDKDEIEKINKEIEQCNEQIEKQCKKSFPIVESLFDSQKEFVVLGLCGKTGSGVSTVSNILNSEFNELSLPSPCEESHADINKTEYRLLFNFAKTNWKKFYKIKTSSLIFSRAIFLKNNDFSEYLLSFVQKNTDTVNQISKDSIEQEINTAYETELCFNIESVEIGNNCFDIEESTIAEFEEFIEKIIGKHYSIETNKTVKIKVKHINEIFYDYMQSRLKKDGYGNFLVYEILYKYIYEELPKITARFWFNLSEKLKLNIKTVALQNMGNHLRITKDNPFNTNKPVADGFSGIAELINISIKLLRDYKYKKVSFFENREEKYLEKDTEKDSAKYSKKDFEKDCKEEKRAFVVIDSIKNPYESMYLKKRYSNYYLIAVYTDEKNRKERLEQNEHLEQKDIQAIDVTEQLSEFKRIQAKYKKWLKDRERDLINSANSGANNSEAILKTKKQLNENVFDNNERLKEIIEEMMNLNADATYPFIIQNIQDCIESADIFINNEDESSSYLNLKKKMLRYISLIMYPGLVLPTKVERCMQIANTAKLCSGCISRQVGAVLTDNKFNLMAIGWNQQPENQVPCLYRDITEVRKHCNQEAYSDYENNDKKSFQINIKKPVDDYYNSNNCSITEQGRSISYCFKDIYNEITNDKNQVHTRSLHAEETAFVNLNKTGANRIEGGFLFTTSSPCELCSKKAMYLGITKIFYVQPYPGISNSHVLSAGDYEERPELELYTGAIGRAYTQLYTPLIPKKDELELWLGHKVSIKNYIKTEISTETGDNNESK